MKKQNSEQMDVENNDIRPEYDFANMAGGVRGKYHEAYYAGHTVKIHEADGATIVQHFTLEEGTVALAPDVREYFSDSGAVNNALRALIALIPQKRETIAIT
ncbi:MAG: hypothetical protein U9R15_15045 [Chloroflexota bacterium]|nr:hypothetical protein [Chloroflexota bacterium]